MAYRRHVSLDGQWEFWTDPASCLNPCDLIDQQSLYINVPAPWQSQSSQLVDYHGAAWYRRQLQIPADWLGETDVVLGFGAVDYIADLWINGSKVGHHEGGYLPFEIKITDLIQPGDNILIVRVDDPPAIFPEIPHGKQGWYGQLSGIWQPVWIESRSRLHINSINIQSHLETGDVQLDIRFSGSGKPVPYQLVIRVTTQDGHLILSTHAPLPFHNEAISLIIKVENPLLWSPEAPNLYHLEAQIVDSAGVIDHLTKSFGFRTIAVRNGKLFLNGKPLYLRAALDQDYYYGSIYSTPSIEFLEDQIHKAKALGLNCLRCHIKVPDPRYYEVADRLGMLVWTEMPNWSVLTNNASERGKELFRGILERDGHHPSIIIWTIINEDWGTDLVNNDSHRTWLKEMYHWLKALDPSRLVVDNSPCSPNFHVESDIEDYHHYRGIPDHRHAWDYFVNTFAAHALWTYSPNGDAVRTGNEPLVVSEFGNWGLPNPEDLKDDQGQEPWWFETGFEWSEGVVYPHGVQKRFSRLGLEQVFGSWKNFISATQWQEFLALKYQIEAMRRRPEISGYVITELTDVHWECNGLLDFRRQPKCFHGALGNINADTILIPDWQTVAYWSGDKVQIGITISLAAGLNLKDVILHWKLAAGEATGLLPVSDLSKENVIQAGTIDFVAPEVTTSIVKRLIFELVDKNQEVISENFLDLYFYPHRSLSSGGIDPRVFPIFTPSTQLANRLRSLDYSVVSNINQARLVITNQADPEILSYVQTGGRMLLLADRSLQGTVFPGIRSVLRQKTQWEGDWASAFSWVRRDGPLGRLPGGPLIDHSFDCIIPDHVLTGFKDSDFISQVRAGIIVGWIHKPAVLIGERRYGNGKVVLNTFHLADNLLGYDPTATTLFDALIELTVC